MTSHEKISVVIPTYNRRERIVGTLDSVFRQTFPPHEVIVIDDGSTDGTGEALEREGYARRIIYLKIDHSGKPAVARNHGIRLATGDWVALLDSDDLWEPTKLQRQIELYAGLGEADRSSCGLIDTFTLVIDAETDAVIARRSSLKDGWCLERIMTGKYVNQTSSVMVKKTVFDQVGLFDDRLLTYDDSEMWLRIARNFSLFTVPEYLNRYRVNTSSISKDMDKNTKDYFVFSNIVRERYADLGEAFIERFLSFRSAHFLQRIYSNRTRDHYIKNFKILFAEDKRVILRSRNILWYLLVSYLDRFRTNR